MVNRFQNYLFEKCVELFSRFDHTAGNAENLELLPDYIYVFNNNMVLFAFFLFQIFFVCDTYIWLLMLKDCKCG